VDIDMTLGSGGAHRSPLGMDVGRPGRAADQVCILWRGRRVRGDRA
jgi:hypothetical protein